MKRNDKFIFFIIVLSLVNLLACFRSKKGEKTVVDRKVHPKLMKDNKEGLKSIHLDRLVGKVNYKEYDYKVITQKDTDEYVLIYSNSLDIKKIEFIKLGMGDVELKEIEVLSSLENIKKGETIIVKAAYPEGIPMLKIRWNTEDNVEDEYIIRNNGGNRSDDKHELVYQN